MSVAIPSLRGAIAVPGWAKNELWRRARAVPSLDLRFAENKSLVDATTGANLVTFTRASSATFVDSQGVIQTAGNDVPRFTHDPVTLESLGLMVEEQRTNSIRNNTMVGAVAGTPGTLPTYWSESLVGLTREVVGVGTENGINYIDLRFSGTSTGTQLIVRSEGNVVVADGQTWTQSLWIKRVAGSLPSSNITLSINLFTSGGVYIGDFGATQVKSLIGTSFARVSGTGTISQPTAGLARPYIFFLMANGEAVDFTIRIGMPQLEQGAFATSVIPTTTTAATRTADVASISDGPSGSNFSGWYRQDQGTFFTDSIHYATPVGGAARRIIEVNNNSEAERLFAGANAATSLQVLSQDNNTIQANIVQTIPAPTASLRHALAFAVDDIASVIGGGAPSVDTAGTLPTPTLLTIGSSTSGGNAWLNSTIRRLTFWPQRLPNSTLQVITQ